METTSTLSQELLRAVTAEPEIAEKVQALVETMEGMIRSKQDAGEFAGLEQLAEDGRVMCRYAEQATGSGDVQRQGFRGVCDAGCLVTGRCGTAVCVPVIELVYQLRVQQGTAVLVPDIAYLS